MAPMSLASRVFTRPARGSLAITTSVRRGSGKIGAQYAFVDRLELTHLADIYVLVDLMHGLANQAKLDNRAMIFDKPSGFARELPKTQSQK